MSDPVTSDYKINLDVFEGPLDLLLHLVKKHELDIFDVPVSFITQKYLDYLELMRQLNLEIAGEYLLMAATLAHIKSRELLPSPDPSQADKDAADEDEESEIDTRQELIRRLLEYQKYKDAALNLGDRPVVGRNVWTRGAAAEDLLPEGLEGDAEPPLAEFPVFSLLEALTDVLSRSRVKMTHDVVVERLSITDRINHLVDRLETEGTFTFESCFEFLQEDAEVGADQVRHQVVVTFLAILEMAKLKLIRIRQPEGLSEIHVTRAVEDVRARARDFGTTGGGEGEYR
jgi:segregation and condensation protein A